MQTMAMRTRWRIGWAVLGSGLAAVAGANTSDVVVLDRAMPPAGGLTLSVRHEVEAAVDRGLDWLAARQAPEGHWSNPQFPALTALAARAFLGRPHPRREAVLAGAIPFLRSCVQEDGGIYRRVPGRTGGGLSTYNTAICMVTLHAVGDPALAPVIQAARTFIGDAQHLGGDIYDGGFGYDAATGRAYADLLNTFYAVEAMRLTQSVEDTRPAAERRGTIDWDRAAAFVSRMQNVDTNEPANVGGFFYRPGESKAGSEVRADDTIVLRSYGSITYAGLLALIYAEVDRDDPRIRSAFDWAARHWSLDENPGMGHEGLYFFFNVLSRALDTYGQDHIPVGDDRLVDWRGELAAKLVARQIVDPDGAGYWVNTSNRFWEADPVLVTAYILLALQYAM